MTGKEIIANEVVYIPKHACTTSIPVSVAHRSSAGHGVAPMWRNPHQEGPIISAEDLFGRLTEILALTSPLVLNDRLKVIASGKASSSGIQFGSCPDSPGTGRQGNAITDQTVGFRPADHLGALSVRLSTHSSTVALQHWRDHQPTGLSRRCLTSGDCGCIREAL